jgi:glutamate/tyrosine decarboxylase-like PLP-dependent enzyme
VHREEIGPVLELVAREALGYLEGLDERPLGLTQAEQVVDTFARPFPEDGEGALAALLELAGPGIDASIASSGPRCFHFVTGGVTPAALGADWLASVLDQNGFAWIESPLSARLETVAIDWLKDLFGLPAEWGGVLTTGATMANFVGLAAARRWWGGRHGRDVDADGLAGLPPVPVFSSGYLHTSAVKALTMLGIGRASPRRFARDDTGRLDAEALEAAFANLDGDPAILIGNAGEVNAGHFDPLDLLADLAERYGAWLHVDGAFGLFARAAPSAAHLAAGVERAHSVIADGHKWLNVPYDCGMAFVRRRSELPYTFSLPAAYLPQEEDPERPNFGYLGPEASRRARALAVWATLRAYGRSGHRAMVERHLELAQRLARRVDEAPDLERLADVPLNIVCFRFRASGLEESELDELNTRLGAEVLTDGRVYLGTTRYAGRVGLRPAIVNWRTCEEDVELLVEVVRELGAGLLARTK